MREPTRACRQRVEYLLMEQNTGERDKSCTEGLTDGLNIGTTYTLLLPGVHSAGFAHAANDL